MQVLECNCGIEHKVPIEVIEIGNGVINKLPRLLDKYHHIYLVADRNTYKVAAERVMQMLEDAQKQVHVCILPPPALPDAASIGNVILEVNREAELILAVGSGSINDVCRVAAFRLGLPYVVVGTAPSMDGYASNISPLIYNNTKTTFKATTPRMIIADTDIMAAAPYDMLLAGIGDMAGKYVAMLDWEFAHLYTNEYYCKKIADMVIGAADKCMATAGSLKSRDTQTVKNMVEGLIISGLGMAYTGVSRPASGSEHMIAHTWEIMDIRQGKVPQLHGLEVAQGSEAAVMMYIKLYRETDDKRLKKLIEKYIDQLQAIAKVFKVAGMKRVVTDKEKIREGLMNARYFRNRFTILAYLDEKGLMEKYVDACTLQFEIEL